MKLGDLLNTKDATYRVPVAIRPSETVMAAVHKLAKHDRGSIMVCNDEGKLLGVISERDIVRPGQNQDTRYYDDKSYRSQT